MLVLEEVLAAEADELVEADELAEAAETVDAREAVEADAIWAVEGAAAI